MQCLLEEAWCAGSECVSCGGWAVALGSGLARRGAAVRVVRRAPQPPYPLTRPPEPPAPLSSLSSEPTHHAGEGNLVFLCEHTNWTTLFWSWLFATLTWELRSKNQPTQIGWREFIYQTTCINEGRRTDESWCQTSRTHPPIVRQLITHKTKEHFSFITM